VRLHRLRLRDFRGVADRELTFHPAGVTVVVGDNETGKSSLLEALRLLFEVPDDSKATKLRAVQPVGSDVGTAVEADISFGTLRLHYRKRWFRQRATELRVEPGGRTWTGREAHDEAARLFGEHVDQTLWAALTVAQEHTLTIPVAGTVTSVLTALDEVAGGEVDHSATVPLAAAVEGEYLRYFTPTGRPTGAYAEALRRRDEAHRVAEEAAARLAEVDQDVARAERLGQDRDRLAARLAEQSRRVSELEERRRTAAELIASVDRLRRDRDLAEQRLVAARGELERRTRLRDEAARREEAAAAAAATAREAAQALRGVERELAQATAQLRAARDDLTARHTAVRAAEAHLARLRDRADLADLEARLAEVRHAQDEERRWAAELDRLTIGEADLEALEAAHRRVLAARAARDAGAPTLLVRRIGLGDIDIDGRPVAGDTELSVAEDTTVAVAGVAEVIVRPGAGVAELAAACADAEHAERALLDRLGLASVAEARQAARARAEAERALRAARETLERRLGGESIDQLLLRRDVLAARLADDLGDDDGAFPPTDVEEARARLSRAQQDEAAAARIVAEAEEREALCRKQYEAASEHATVARVRAEQELERRDDALAALAGARAERDDEELRGEVRACESQLTAVAEELARAEKALAASGLDTVEDQLAEATSLRDQLARQVEELHDELRRVEGRLEMAGAHGLASAVERTRADLAQAEARLEILERRAGAARRLRETLVRHQVEARRRYAAPLRERIEALGRVLHGPSFGVVLGEDLEVRARVIDGVSLPVTSLSTGAREQLATIVRLAIAGLTAADGSGVPVVLDDALGWSDPARLQAMGSLLARAGSTTQVILLTCVPDRYVGTVPGARIVRL
jgi:hypothetical protein